MTDFHLLISNWYRQNKRDLPWRHTNNPYFIWLSEVILQQTRVDQGLSYYHRFTEHYPTVQDLANASEQDILNDWQGLGYYSRARNLHHTAQLISSEYDGHFPDNYAGLIQLKGIGPYTAAAIASFAFGEAVAVVDGNVYRVLSRVFDIETAIDSTAGKKEFQELANSLISSTNPGEYNQGMMEFGATWCTPVNPKCDSCIIQTCLARSRNTISERPVKSKKTKVRDRYFYYGIFRQDNRICIQKRTQRDIWQHLYEFPLLEAEQAIAEEVLSDKLADYFETRPVRISPEIKHILSHQRIHARFAFFNSIPKQLEAQTIAIEDLDNYPLPRLIDRFLSESGYE